MLRAVPNTVPGVSSIIFGAHQERALFCIPYTGKSPTDTSFVFKACLKQSWRSVKENLHFSAGCAGRNQACVLDNFNLHPAKDLFFLPGRETHSASSKITVSSCFMKIHLSNLGAYLEKMLGHTFFFVESCLPYHCGTQKLCLC